MNQVDPLTKQFIEMIIKDILQSNPNIDNYNDIFYFKNKKIKIESNEYLIDLILGFATSFVETNKGFFINIPRYFNVSLFK